MSTAGKVLVVLVMLVVPIWVTLVSAVAETNKTWGEQVQKLEGQVKKLQEDVKAARQDLVATKDQISRDQVAMAERIAMLRSRKVDVEKRLSETIEIATRLKLRLKATQDEIKQAEATRDLRAAEKTAEIRQGRRRSRGRATQARARHARRRAQTAPRPVQVDCRFESEDRQAPSGGSLILMMISR